MYRMLAFIFVQTWFTTALLCLAAQPMPEQDAGAPPAPSQEHKIDVQVVDENGAAVADALVGAMSLERVLVKTRTDAAGRATLRISSEQPLETIWAVKPGVGLDYLAITDEGTEPETENANDAERQPATETTEGGVTEDLLGVEQPLELVLNGTREISVRVIDEYSREPLPGATVLPWYVYKPGKAAELNVSGLREFLQETDEQGTAKLDIVPIDNAARTPLLVAASGYIAHEPFLLDPGANAAEVTVELYRLVSVTGRVVDTDGSPAAGATVLAAGDGHHYGYFRSSTQTGDDGTFEIEVGPEEYYSLVAQQATSVSLVKNLVVRKREPVSGIDLKLQRGTRLHGRVTAGPEKEPVAGYLLRLCQQPAEEYAGVPADAELANPQGSRDYIQPLIERRTQTDETGAFEFFVGPGRYYLVGPTSAPVPRFTVTDEEELQVNLAAHDEKD